MRKNSDTKIWLAILFIFGLRIIIAAGMNLVPDETYYWDWSRFLSLGYFDHPPMVAWLVFLSTAILGDTFWAIKAVPLLGGLGITILLFYLGRRYLIREISLILLLVLANFTLIFSIGGLILTPDIPMVFFWVLSLLLAYQALFEDKTWAWPLLGIVAGFGLLSKYVFVLFGLSFLLYLIFDSTQRKILRTWKPWSALFLSIIIFSPNIYWNIQHRWASFAFQLGSRAGQPDFGKRLTYFLEYVGAEIGLLSPFIFYVLILATILILKRFLRNQPLRFLLFFTFVPLFFFALFSWRNRIEPNWPAAALITAILLVIWFREISLEKQGIIRFINFAIIFSVLTTFIVTMHGLFPFLPIKSEKDRTAEQRGWKEWAAEVNEIRIKSDPRLVYPVTANSYQVTSMLAFYFPDHPRTYSLNLHVRSNHYAFLPARENALKDTIIFVTELYQGELPKDYLEVFEYYQILKITDRPIGPEYSKHYGVLKGILRESFDG
ncbi:MAG: glycosyltransferase family 39 protein [bacterium]|nr:MAG: glycosyltransferase family 39 protein [bacterium]